MSKQLIYNQNLREKRKAKGLCINCNKPAMPRHYLCEAHLKSAIEQREKAKRVKANCNHYIKLGFSYCPLCGASVKKLKKNMKLINSINEQKPLNRSEVAETRPQNIMNPNSYNITNKDDYVSTTEPVKPILPDIAQFLAQKGIAPKPITEPIPKPAPTQTYTRKSTNHVSFKPEYDSNVHLDTDF
jgi:hypothetical protein